MKLLASKKTSFKSISKSCVDYKDWAESLPFKLTDKQIEAIEDIKSDLSNIIDFIDQLNTVDTEGVELEFTDDGVKRIAEIASSVNEKSENIGARRLHTVMERLLDEISYDAPDKSGSKVTIDAAYVDNSLGELVKDEDLSRYIL